MSGRMDVCVYMYMYSTCTCTLYMYTLKVVPAQAATGVFVYFRDKR